MALFRELNKTYEPQEIEPRWAELWINRAWYRAALDSARPTWSLVIPPPNVTGSLHMGHMLEHTEIDALARWRRMSGDNVLWLPGTDHAGIATQMVVERELAKQGLERRALGREEFLKHVWAWKEQSGGTIQRQMKRLGASCDWSRERFTLDACLSRAVREVFVSLYEEGLIYRGRYIVNWCPRCQTAVSDLEVVHEETVGKLYHIRYPLAGDPARGIVVATTRPETMLGDTAVAVNERDERYRDFFGKQLELPLTGRHIPVICDELAQPEFGTGAVKVTPSHDPNDFAAGQRHHLPQIDVMDETGHMNQNAGSYSGLDRFAARKQIVADLEAQGLLLKVADHPMAIGHCQRCRTIIEPRISTQWFVKVAPLAEDAIRVVEDGSIRFVPENNQGIYLNWMRNIHDWCISRQLWWGHRIPAWYCDQCHQVVVAREDPSRCSCGGELRQDPDVLDTWFSSALWPFSTLGWPAQSADLQKFYPTTLLVTGFDILFFWVARMILMGVHFMKRDGRPLSEAVPFRTVYIHALVRDADKQKMSKTKGNVIDPLAMTEKYGTDAVRFTLAAMAAPGTDIALSEARMEGYAAFANKIWNAARFLFMSLDRALEQHPGAWDATSFQPGAALPQCVGSELSDRWIFSRLGRVIERIDESFRAYRFHDVADTLYHFVWHEFCDWYIELLKPRLASDDATEVGAAARNALTVFEAALRLLHPLMPFISEELWNTLPNASQAAPTIALAAFPAPPAADAAAERQMDLLQAVVNEVRRMRGEWKVPPRARLRAKIAAAASQRADLQANLVSIQTLAGLEQLDVVERITKPGLGYAAATAFQIQLDLAGAIDVAGERQRLMRDLQTITKGYDSAVRQLGNEEFRQRAPQKVIQELERKQQDLGRQREQLEQSLRALETLNV